MATKAAVEGFLAQKKFAVIGASRSGGKMGNAVIKELGAKGYTLYPIHPDADTVDGVKSYRSFSELPERVEAAYIAVAPAKTKTAVHQAHEAGVSRIWIQQGAESEQASELAEKGGGAVINGECVLMFAEPAAFYHKIHRWIWKMLGRLPA